MPRLGQHFLTDPSYLSRITEAADLAVGETVLEIGPGRGHLTQQLVDAGANVIAIEIDRRLARKLPDRVRDPDDRLSVVVGDAVELDWPRFDKLVANLPYQISSPAIFRLIEQEYERAILTVQKEFAERLVAETGTKHASRLTVKVALRAEADVLFTIPPGAFTPPPEIDSACVRITPKPGPDPEDEELMHQLIDHAFAHRRKMLRSSLKEAEGVRQALEAMGIETRRPAKIEPEDWIELADRVARIRREAR